MRNPLQSHKFRRCVVGLCLSTGLIMPVSLSYPGLVASASSSLIPISVGYAPNSPFTGDNTVAVANFLGLWQKAGLKLVPQVFTAAPLVEVVALESNHLDVLCAGAGAVHLAMLGDARILGATDFGEQDAVIVDGSIHSVSQLRGKSVIYDSGTTGEMILDLALNNAGLKLSDIHGIDIGDEGSMISAFLSGDAAAVGTWAPISTTILSKDPTAHVIFSDKSAYPKYVLPGEWLTSNSYAKQNPQTLSRFMWVYDKAQQWTIAHPAQTIRLIAAMNKVPLNYVEAGAPPDNDKVVLPGVLNSAYTTGLGVSWFAALAKVFEQMGVLTSSAVVPSSKYLDFGPEISAYKQINNAQFLSS